MFIQIQNEDLAQSLGLSTGKYLIKQSVNKFPSQQRPKKRLRKSLKDNLSAAEPKNSAAKAGEMGNPGVGNSVMQTNDFDELMDSQKLIEFAMRSENPKDIGDFDPAQMLQSTYLEGPIITIQEFPGGMPVISDGNSSANDEELLCYIAPSSQSAGVVSDNTEQSLSFKQSLMQSSASATQNSALTFPLTLTVDGSTLDSCSALQFS